MNAPNPDPGAAAYPSAKRLACPKCGGDLSRIPRRIVDRLLSVFRPVQRYRCRNFACQWIGNIPSGSRTVDPTDRTPL